MKHPFIEDKFLKVASKTQGFLHILVFLFVTLGLLYQISIYSFSPNKFGRLVTSQKGQTFEMIKNHKTNNQTYHSQKLPLDNFSGQESEGDDDSEDEIVLNFLLKKYLSQIPFYKSLAIFRDLHLYNDDFILELFRPPIC